jgi:hypothetical protein
LVISGIHKPIIHQRGLRMKLIMAHLDNDNCHGRG